MAGEMRELEQTLLGQAIKGGSLKKVKKLLQDGEDILFKDRKENTYLHYICIMYKPYVFNVIVSSGVDINAPNVHGNTPLHITALSHECCHVTDLMASGSNPSIKNGMDKTAFDVAKSQNSKKWLDLYLKYEPGLRQAVLKRDMDRIYELLHAWSACHLVVDGKDMRYFAANLTYHDIVAIVDKYRFNIKAVYAIYEKDVDSLEYCISRGKEQCDVNYLQILENSHPHHMLQHAIRQNSFKMVEMICDAGADVNLSVHVKEYFKGPLFFEALQFKKGFDQRIVHKVLDSGADLTLKDERGRTALLYVLDRGNGEVPIEIIQKLLSMGASISDRDETGITPRNMAVFGQCVDVCEEIDQHLITFVRQPDMEMLQSLAMDGYDRIITEYQYRDTWIFACGNPYPHAQKFVENLENYEKAAMALHQVIENGEGVEEFEYIYDTFEAEQFYSDMLLQYKDKGGRNPLLKALLYNETEIALWLLEKNIKCVTHSVDNMCRSALHYAYALEYDGEETVYMLQKNGVVTTSDCRGNLAHNMGKDGSEFIKIEKQKTYGLDLEVHCAEKYAKMMKIIHSKHREKRHFENVLRDLKCSIAELPVVLHPNKIPLVYNYKDLLLEAINQNREDIACKLAFLGVDCSIREPYEGVLWPGCPVWMNAEERARLLGLHKVADYIVKYGTDKDYWGLGIKDYLIQYS